MLFIALLLLNIVVAALIKIYCQLSCGICKCNKHLVGKVVIVTGANAGIGYETAKNLAERGAKVILACRNESRGINARDKIIAETGNENVLYQHLDLASLKSVRKFADDILNNEERLDVLVNNAGICESKYEKTDDGLLLAMQTNHFGPFLLTNLLIPLLKSSAPSRIVNVSSIAHKRGQVDFNNLNMEALPKSDYSFQVYRNTKLFNVLMTTELARRLEGTGITTNCLHPGVVETDIIMNIDAGWWAKVALPIAKHFFKTPWEGAQTSIYLAVSPEVDNVSGAYFSDCREARLPKIAQDMDVARKLWEVSERLVKLK